MASPAWLNDSFAVLMAAVAVYCLGRLIAARRWGRPTHLDVDTAHVVMGTAMAGMLVPSVNLFPDQLWEVAFVGLSLWFVVRCIRFVTEHGIEGRDEDHAHHLSHYLTHLVMALAMLYMYFAAVPTVDAGGGMAMGSATGTTTDFVGIPLVFIIILFASGIWELDGIGRFLPATAPGEPVTVAAAGPGLGAVAGPGPEPIGGGGARSRPEVQPAGSRWLAPRLEAGSHVAMCVTMGFMLVLML